MLSDTSQHSTNNSPCIQCMQYETRVILLIPTMHSKDIPLCVRRSAAMVTTASSHINNQAIAILEHVDEMLVNLNDSVCLALRSLAIAFRRYLGLLDWERYGTHLPRIGSELVTLFFTV